MVSGDSNALLRAGLSIWWLSVVLPGCVFSILTWIQGIKFQPLQVLLRSTRVFLFRSYFRLSNPCVFDAVSASVWLAVGVLRHKCIGLRFKSLGFPRSSTVLPTVTTV